MTERERDYLVDTLENFELVQKDNRNDLDPNAHWSASFDIIVKDIQYETAIRLLRSIIRTFDSMAKGQHFYDETRKGNG